MQCYRKFTKSQILPFFLTGHIIKIENTESYTHAFADYPYTFIHLFAQYALRVESKKTIFLKAKAIVHILRSTIKYIDWICSRSRIFSTFKYQPKNSLLDRTEIFWITIRQKRDTEVLNERGNLLVISKTAKKRKKGHQPILHIILLQFFVNEGQ